MSVSDVRSSLLGENLASHNHLLSVFKTGLSKQANGLGEASLVSGESKADVPSDLSKACVTLFLSSGMLRVFPRPFLNQVL